MRTCPNCNESLSNALFTANSDKCRKCLEDMGMIKNNGNMRELASKKTIVDLPSLSSEQGILDAYDHRNRITFRDFIKFTS